MWFIQWLPESILLWIINGLIILGVLGLLIASFLRLVPFINIYRIPIQLVCAGMLVLGVYYRGAWEIEMTWRQRVAELEREVQAAEERSKKINTKIVTRVKTRVKRQVEYRDRVQKEIEIKREIINADCKLSPTAVELYNRAVKGADNE